MDELYEELNFKRFAPEKQEQIRQLVAYTTMLGLTGKDLVSIGGKLDRIKARNEINDNRNLVLTIPVRTIGKDDTMRTRWAYVYDGTTYHFTDPGWWSVKIKNTKTNKTKTVVISEFYEFGKFNINGNRYLPNIMLNVYRGDIKLDF